MCNSASYQGSQLTGGAAIASPSSHESAVLGRVFPSFFRAHDSPMKVELEGIPTSLLASLAVSSQPKANHEAAVPYDAAKSLTAPPQAWPWGLF